MRTARSYRRRLDGRSRLASVPSFPHRLAVIFAVIPDVCSVASVRWHICTLHCTCTWRSCLEWHVCNHPPLQKVEPPRSLTGGGVPDCRRAPVVAVPVDEVLMTAGEPPARTRTNTAHEWIPVTVGLVPERTHTNTQKTHIGLLMLASELLERTHAHTHITDTNYTQNTRQSLEACFVGKWTGIAMFFHTLHSRSRRREQ